MGMPVNIKSPVSSLFELFQSEGETRTMGTASNNLTFATGSINVGVSPPALSPNRCMFIESLIVSANVYAHAQISIGGGIRSDSANYQIFPLSVTPNASVVIPVQQIVRQHDLAFGNLSFNIRRLRNADGTDATVAVTGTGFGTIAAVGRVLYDDLNFAADRVLLLTGDSIFNGVGRTKKTDMYDWKIRQFYTDAGQSVRGTMFAVSGSNSSEHETWRQMGSFDRPQVDLWVYEPMINDAAQAVSPAVYGANLSAAIAHKQKLYPSAKMLVLGCHPLQNATYEAQAALLRAAAQSIVAAAADPKVFFCNLGQLGSVFSANALNYAASDGVGQGIHTTAQGDAFIFGGNLSAGGTFSGLRAFLSENIPRI